MQEPPPQVSETDLLELVRGTWEPAVTRVEHLPVGFGAHHWAASDDHGRRLFVTLDTLGARHTAASLTAAYDGAVALAQTGLEFVLACLPPVARPLAGGLVSATPWRDGTVAERIDPATTGDLLARLHATAPPPGLPVWRPLVEAGLADDLATRLRRPWTAGPLSATAHAALSDRIGAIATWVSRYHRLAEEARHRPAVPTHGEPHHRNQLVTPTGTLLVDWESLKLAPAERDL